MLLPTAAIQRNSKRPTCFWCKPDNTVTVRHITIGTTEGDDSEITSGLAPGDTVVMTGVDKLQEGSKWTRTSTMQGTHRARPAACRRWPALRPAAPRTGNSTSKGNSKGR